MLHYHFTTHEQLSSFVSAVPRFVPSQPPATRHILSTCTVIRSTIYHLQRFYNRLRALKWRHGVTRCPATALCPHFLLAPFRQWGCMMGKLLLIWSRLPQENSARRMPKQHTLIDTSNSIFLRQKSHSFRKELHIVCYHLGNSAK